MKNSKRESEIELFVLKKKTNNEGMLNPIVYCSYASPSVHISTEKNLQVFMGKKENIMGLEIHPIPSHGITTF